MTEPCFTVTDTTFIPHRGIGEAPECRAMRAWVTALTRGDWPADMFYLRGDWPALFPLDCAVYRDCVNNRVIYQYVNDLTHPRSVEDCLSTATVQLEATPPPWPPEIARHVTPTRQ